MKFAHMADCHVGSWRDPRMAFVNTDAFCKAIDTCIERSVDFILIAGDLFNTSLPPLDKLKVAVKKLRELREEGIPVYIIAGSHDFSPSGKTMLDVLENADLLVNVSKGDVVGEKLRLKFTVDTKTGAKITGLLGRRNMLEKAYYENLDRESLEAEKGFKIFMFHSALTELRIKGMEHAESGPISFLPKGFDYYAGGHVHAAVSQHFKDYGLVAYPGPLFPNTFSELEELCYGGFYIYESAIFSNGMQGEPKLGYVPLKAIETVHFSLDCSQKQPDKIRQELLEMIEKEDVQHKIVTLRLFGNIAGGKVSDIDLQEVLAKLNEKRAYFVMKNTNKLQSESYEEIKVQHASVEDIEESTIREHLGQVKIDGLDAEKESLLIGALMKALSSEKNEGERVADFEKRIVDETGKLMDLG